MTPILTQSRFARIVGAVALLVLATFVVRPEETKRRMFLDEPERMRASSLAIDLWANAIAARCPRPALREPMNGDGSQILVAFTMHESPESQCLLSLEQLAKELLPERRCEKPRRCFIPFAALAARAQTVERYAVTCAPLYATIARVARSSEACSPVRPPNDELGDDLHVRHIALAVRIQIVRLVEHGELLAAARHVTDAMRAIDDYSRGADTLTAMVSVSSFQPLAEILRELLADPRLTTADIAAIGRDLDVLHASAPTFDAMARTRAARVASFLAQKDPDEIPNDGSAVLVLGVVRWLERVDRACRDKSARVCADNLPTGRLYRYADLERERSSGDEPTIVRERVIEMSASVHATTMHYDASLLVEREEALHALRLQASR